ncbi:MurR/RpiR family transcriptional regulator [Proteiniclasticum sp.]|uniref:MurR/RpiR family transcriptional regulator n=1 Tax=Proteiniclasticum sp. TaxID=2053595 RepID=UPI0028A1895B|nr:MurR/RpiR family transcriptional regulator [Proteiniclasticum sp.]
MKLSDIYSTIETLYNTFTKSEKKIADYTLKTRDKVMYMSITELSDELGVGEASIFRFCKTLGLSGYQDFKIAIANSTSEDKTSQKIYSDIHKEDSMELIAEKVRNANLSAIEDTFSLINYDELKQAAEMMIEADHIRFFGVGSSYTTALEGHIKFLRITSKTSATFDSHLQAMTAALMNEKEVAVIISFSGETRDTIDVAAQAKKAGAKIIAITRYQKSPLTEYADVVLLTGAVEGPLQGGSTTAKVAQLYLMDILYTRFFLMNYEKSEGNKEQTLQSVLSKLY